MTAYVWVFRALARPGAPPRALHHLHEQAVELVGVDVDVDADAAAAASAAAAGAGAARGIAPESGSWPRGRGSGPRPWVCWSQMVTRRSSSIVDLASRSSVREMSC